MDAGAHDARNGSPVGPRGRDDHDARRTNAIGVDPGRRDPVDPNLKRSCVSRAKHGNDTQRRADRLGPSERDVQPRRDEDRLPNDRRTGDGCEERLGHRDRQCAVPEPLPGHVDGHLRLDGRTQRDLLPVLRVPGHGEVKRDRSDGRDPVRSGVGRQHRMEAAAAVDVMDSPARLGRPITERPTVLRRAAPGMEGDPQRRGAADDRDGNRAGGVSRRSEREGESGNGCNARSHPAQRNRRGGRHQAACE